MLLRTPTSSQTRFSRPAGALPVSPPLGRSVFRVANAAQRPAPVPRSIGSALIADALPAQNTISKHDEYSAAKVEENFVESSRIICSAINRDDEVTTIKSTSSELPEAEECSPAVSFIPTVDDVNHSLPVPEYDDKSVSNHSELNLSESFISQCQTINTVVDEDNGKKISDIEINERENKVFETAIENVCFMENNPDEKKSTISCNIDESVESPSVCDLENSSSCDQIKISMCENIELRKLRKEGIVNSENRDINEASNNNCDKSPRCVLEEGINDNNNECSLADTSHPTSLEPNSNSTRSVSSCIAKFNSLGQGNLSTKTSNNSVSLINRNRLAECDDVPSNVINKDHSLDCYSCDDNLKSTKESIYCNKENVDVPHTSSINDNIIQSSLCQLGLQNSTSRHISSIREPFKIGQRGPESGPDSFNHFMEISATNEHRSSGNIKEKPKTASRKDIEVGVERLIIRTADYDTDALSPAFAKHSPPVDETSMCDESIILSASVCEAINTGFICDDSSILDCESLDSAIEASASAAVSRRARRSVVQPCIRSPPIDIPPPPLRGSSISVVPNPLRNDALRPSLSNHHQSQLICNVKRSNNAPSGHSSDSVKRLAGEVAAHPVVPLSKSVRYEDCMPQPATQGHSRYLRNRVSKPISIHKSSLLCHCQCTS